MLTSAAVETTEYDVARAMRRVTDRYALAFRVDDDEQSPPTLHVAILAELHPSGALNANAQALVTYIRQTRSSRLTWVHRVESALRPRLWHSYRWHARHRPWLVE